MLATLGGPPPGFPCIPTSASRLSGPISSIRPGWRYSFWGRIPPTMTWIWLAASALVGPAPLPSSRRKPNRVGGKTRSFTFQVVLARLGNGLFIYPDHGIATSIIDHSRRQTLPSGRLRRLTARVIFLGCNERFFVPQLAAKILTMAGNGHADCNFQADHLVLTADVSAPVTARRLLHDNAPLLSSARCQRRLSRGGSTASLANDAVPGARRRKRMPDSRKQRAKRFAPAYLSAPPVRSPVCSTENRDSGSCIRAVSVRSSLHICKQQRTEK